MKILFFAAFVAFVAGLPACQSATQREGDMAVQIAAGANRAFYHEAATKAEPSEVWRLWTDVSSWKDWDKGLKDAVLDGDFRAGAEGKIIPLSGRPSRFDVTEYEEGASYAFETRLPFARLEVRRSFVGANPTVFRHDVRFKGVLAGFWADRFGPEFRKALPPTMDAIAELAEQSMETRP